MSEIPHADAALCTLMWTTEDAALGSMDIGTLVWVV